MAEQPKREQQGKDQTKQIELSAERAKALNAAIEQLNAANALAQARVKAHQEAAKLHSEAAQQQQEAFSRMLAMHQTHVAALVKEAGMKPEDFQQHGVFPEGEKWFLRAQQQPAQ